MPDPIPDPGPAVYVGALLPPVDVAGPPPFGPLPDDAVELEDAVSVELVELSVEVRLVVEEVLVEFSEVVNAIVVELELELEKAVVVVLLLRPNPIHARISDNSRTRYTCKHSPVLVEFPKGKLEAVGEITGVDVVVNGYAGTVGRVKVGKAGTEGTVGS
jgi:hypothetical protein